MKNQYSHFDIPNLCWFLVHCKPNAVNMARQNLINQDFVVFLPLQKITKRKAKRFQTILRPLFPGYLFVQLDPLAGHWRKINNTRGVARLVQLGANPCPVPDSIIAALLERCDADHVLQKPGKLEVGQKAQILKGPFSGLIAEIIEVEPDTRVHLLLDLMGRATQLSVSPSIVVPAKRNKRPII